MTVNARSWKNHHSAKVNALPASQTPEAHRRERRRRLSIPSLLVFETRAESKMLRASIVVCTTSFLIGQSVLEAYFTLFTKDLP